MVAHIEVCSSYSFIIFFDVANDAIVCKRWMKELSLLVSDQDILLNGHKLNDSIVNACQTLYQSNFQNWLDLKILYLVKGSNLRLSHRLK